MPWYDCNLVYYEVFCYLDRIDQDNVLLATLGIVENTVEALVVAGEAREQGIITIAHTVVVVVLIMIRVDLGFVVQYHVEECKLNGWEQDWIAKLLSECRLNDKTVIRM
jgi:hypothetical protein